MKAVYSLALAGGVLLSGLTWTGQTYLENAINIVEQLINKVEDLESQLEVANARIEELENRPPSYTIPFEEGMRNLNDHMYANYDWWNNETLHTFEVIPGAENALAIRKGENDILSNISGEEFAEVFSMSFGVQVRYIRQYWDSIILQLDWPEQFPRAAAGFAVEATKEEVECVEYINSNVPGYSSHDIPNDLVEVEEITEEPAEEYMYEIKEMEEIENGEINGE